MCVHWRIYWSYSLKCRAPSQWSNDLTLVIISPVVGESEQTVLIATNRRTHTHTNYIPVDFQLFSKMMANNSVQRSLHPYT